MDFYLHIVLSFQYMFQNKYKFYFLNYFVNYNAPILSFSKPWVKINVRN